MVKEWKSKVNWSKAATHYQVEELAKTINEAHELFGRALYIFGPTNKFRLFCNKLVHAPYFDNFILLLIVISTINLALENPLDDPKARKLEILGYIDYGMTAVFTIEMLLKMIAFGLIINKE